MVVQPGNLFHFGHRALTPDSYIFRSFSDDCKSQSGDSARHTFFGNAEIGVDLICVSRGIVICSEEPVNGLSYMYSFSWN